MNKTIVLLAMAMSSGSTWADDDMPKEFLGRWVAQTQSCANSGAAAIKIEREAIELSDARGKLTYRDIEVCYSCEGGSRYNGIVLWATPKQTPAPFVLYLNAHEHAGAAEIEILDETLQRRFPSGTTALQHCMQAKP
jgi:hypothetical protein